MKIPGNIPARIILLTGLIISQTGLAPAYANPAYSPTDNQVAQDSSGTTLAKSAAELGAEAERISSQASQGVEQAAILHALTGNWKLRTTMPEPVSGRRMVLSFDNVGHFVQASYHPSKNEYNYVSIGATDFALDANGDLMPALIEADRTLSAETQTSTTSSKDTLFAGRMTVEQNGKQEELVIITPATSNSITNTTYRFQRIKNGTGKSPLGSWVITGAGSVLKPASENSCVRQDNGLFDFGAAVQCSFLYVLGGSLLSVDLTNTGEELENNGLTLMRARREGDLFTVSHIVANTRKNLEVRRTAMMGMRLQLSHSQQGDSVRILQQVPDLSPDGRLINVPTLHASRILSESERRSVKALQPH